jgi:manganese/zinc/iron transport system substrate-binding protein
MFLVDQKMFFDNPKSRALAVAAATALALVLPAAGAEPPAATVVATTTVVADLVRQVGGDRVAVDCLMGAGIDPHSYRPTPRDADRLAAADLVVASGLHLEGKLATLLERLGSSRPVAVVGDSLPTGELLAVGGG